KAETSKQQRLDKHQLRNGERLSGTDSTNSGPKVSMEPDVTIYPGTMILGETTIGTGNIIGANCEIENCTIGNDNVIRQSVVKNSKIGNKTNIGPFAHIRPETAIGDLA